MTPNEGLQQLKQGQSITCINPASGIRFEIQSKLSHGLAWYRVFPARIGCLNRYSRLSDDDMLRWLGSLALTGLTKPITAQMRG